MEIARRLPRQFKSTMRELVSESKPFGIHLRYKSPLIDPSFPTENPDGCADYETFIDFVHFKMPIGVTISRIARVARVRMLTISERGRDEHSNQMARFGVE